MKALIAGGGIGGLAASIALAQHGWNVETFERQPEIRASGSGIYIWENGLRVLGALGISDIAREAFRGLAFEQRDKSDRVIDGGTLPTEVRLITIPRGHLVESLRARAKAVGVVLHTNTEVLGVSAHGTMQLSGGRSISGDLAVAADGVWSPARRLLGLEVSHELTPEGGQRTIIDATQDDLGTDGHDRYIENWSGSRRLLITPISTSQIYLALTCLDDDEEGKRWPLDKDSWSAHFPRWANLIRRIESTLPWSPYSIIKVRRWSAGQAAILGDAAHAQPPNLGQGAGIAMQSALSLGHHLSGVSDRRDVADALAAWETSTRPLVDHCQKWSCLYGEAAFLPDAVRARVVAPLMDDPWVREQLLLAAKSTPIGGCVARNDRKSKNEKGEHNDK